MNKKHYILVVEDEPDSQDVISYILTFHGFKVDIAQNADDASILLFHERRPYHLIVLDLALPGKSGWQLLNDILTHPDTVNIPCVAVTAYHDSATRARAIREGFLGYFPKPVPINKFIDNVKNLL